MSSQFFFCVFKKMGTEPIFEGFHPLEIYISKYMFKSADCNGEGLFVNFA